MGVVQTIILANPLLFVGAIHTFLCRFFLLQLASLSTLILCSGTPGLLHVSQHQRVEELRCLCAYRLNYQSTLHIWP